MNIGGALQLSHPSLNFFYFDSFSYAILMLLNVVLNATQVLGS